MASSDMIHAGVQTMEPLDRTPRQSVDRPGRAGILQPFRRPAVTAPHVTFSLVAKATSPSMRVLFEFDELGHEPHEH